MNYFGVGEDKENEKGQEGGDSHWICYLNYNIHGL